jgi:hypothetical protein
VPEAWPPAESEEAVESQPLEGEPEEGQPEEGQPEGDRPLTASGLPSQGPLQSEGRRPRERLATEARRERLPGTRRRRHHGLLYRWVAAYLPLVAALFLALGALFVYETFFRPPTPAERWQQITDKWSPPREAARAALTADTLDFVKQLDDYKNFYDATKGWVDDVRGYTNWGDPTSEVRADINNFLNDSDNYLSLLNRAAQAKTADEIVAMKDSLPAADATWDTDVALIRLGLGLSAVPATPSPLPLPSLACIPVSSGSPAATASPLGSPTPTPSGSVAPTLPPCAPPTSSPGATFSPTPSPSESPSPSPSPSPSAS